MKKNRLKLFAVIILIASVLASCTTSAPSGGYAPPKKNITVSLGTSSLTLISGQSHTFSPTFKNTDTAPDLVWTSSDQSILSVSPDGTITAENTTDGNITATITAAIADNPNMKSVCTVTVFPEEKTHFLTAGPGQDASSQIIISWHNPQGTCTLEYTEASGSEFTHSIAVEGEPTVSDWADLSSIYRYNVTLTDLVPDSEYRYRVVTPDGKASETQSFRTAGTDGTFSFAWMSDIHASTAASLQNFQTLLKTAGEKADLSFCLFTGDMVNQGKRYTYWESWTDSSVLSEMAYAFVIGNHEYYPYNGPENATASYYLDFAAIPGNHGTSAESDYWFLYNNVLFICLDTMAAEFAKKENPNPVLEKQAEWLKNVIEINEGKYTYIIVAQHYAFLDGDKKGTGFYSFWYPYFDKYGVDLALSSDTHAYSRSKVLCNDEVSETGTVYLTSPMSEGKTLSEISNTDQLGDRSAFNTAKTVSGGAYIEVTPQSLTVHVIGKDGIEYDSVTIPAK
ncbi:MAG: metallophosphoesterase [Spirochaetales bacterium]|nr:metallophosphoesterase [Spirochaetales bacterium]